MEFTLDNIRGGFLGISLGDALGLPVEMLGPEEIMKRTNGKGIQDFDHGIVRQEKNGVIIPPLSCSDDEQMSHCIAKSLIRCKGFNLLDQALAHIQELDTTQAGWGRAHREGLTEIKEYFASYGTKGRSPYTPVAFVANKGTGNGVAMKIWPLIWYQMIGCQKNKKYSEYDDFKQIAQIAGLTHGDRRAWAAAAALYIFFCREEFFNDKDTFSALKYYLSSFERKYGSNCQKKFSSFLTPLEDTNLLHGPIKKLRDVIGTQCVATQSVPFAIALMLRHYDIKSALLEAVNNSYDSDTIGAIVGGYFGFKNGYAVIPEKWKTILPHTSQILNLADRFYHTFWTS